MRIIAFYIIGLVLLTGCQTEPTLFDEVPAEHSGVKFNNEVHYSDSLNILRYEYIYNGGGVAIDDFNNDGLEDVLFTGNIVDNALYLNKGKFTFEDVSDMSGIAPSGRWSTGVTVVDINLDGLKDIYITASGHEGVAERGNQLFVCSSINPDGVPIYREMSMSYGLRDTSFSVHAAFFDYDNDEDLDLIVINNDMVSDRQPSKYRRRPDQIVSPRTDQLFKNTWDDQRGHPVFEEVSIDAGITKEGFSLGLNIYDFNQDGWKDIFITNDYLSTDLLYINQQDGTFEDQADVYFKHTSFSAMGNDVVDLDNDGLNEVVALDMLPDDNYRKKTMLPANNYTSYINNDKFGYQYQHVRNTLQKNNFDKKTAGVKFQFSEQALISGVAATDWSWAPVVADFDNDGDRDMIVTNGFPQDITDRDFIDYNTMNSRYISDMRLLEAVPSVKIPNVAFENLGSLQFEKRSAEWGIDRPSFSNGAAYGDLDNDGDLDLVINNINDIATIYENKGGETNWLDVDLIGPATNPESIGSRIILRGDDQIQSAEVVHGHGYLSSISTTIHFGWQAPQDYNRLEILWPNGFATELPIDEINKKIVIDYSEVSKKEAVEKSPKYTIEVTDRTAERGLDFLHKDTDYNDFSVQPMLLHKLSQYGPGIAVSDVNGDGREDFYVSGSHFNNGSFFLQQEDGSFREDQLIIDTLGTKPGEELGALFFDADSDGDMDLYTAMGGYEYDLVDSIYQDRLYLNEGGVLRHAVDALPQFVASSLAVKAGDIDGDGDLDLFVGGRQVPGDYPLPASSYILQNDSDDGTVRFTDITKSFAPGLEKIGLVTDALWTDINNDQALDLIVVGEFMPITVFKNMGGALQDISEDLGLADHVGWWNSIAGGDFDNDGDTDYVCGNYGDHSLAPISDQHPLKVYYKDFDDNGSRDLVPTCWFEDQNGQKREFTYFGRLDYEKQLIRIKGQFLKHADFANATVSDIFSEEQLNDCLTLSANYMKSSFIRNNGDHSFDIIPLPSVTQVAPVYGSIVKDINDDDFLDVLLIGNDFGMEISIGRMDGHDGLVLLGQGDGSFLPYHASQTGFYVQGDAKALATIYNTAESTVDILATQNKGRLKLYSSGNTKRSVFKFLNGETHAQAFFRNGGSRRIENYFGQSYLGQSSSYLELSVGVEKIEVMSRKNLERTLDYND